MTLDGYVDDLLRQCGMLVERRVAATWEPPAFEVVEFRDPDPWPLELYWQQRCTWLRNRKYMA